MRSRRLITALLFVCAWVAASALPSAQTPAQAPKLTMEGFPAQGEPARVTVLSTGAAPKKALRYSVPADFKGRLDMTTAMNMSMNVMGQAMEMPVPAIKMGVDLDVTSIAANGDISYKLAFTGMTMDGDASSPLAMAMQGAMGAISGVKGTTTMTNRGVSKSSNLEASDPTLKAMLDQMTTSIENLSAALPEEAVGVGARWEVRQAISAGGQTQFQKAVYEITSIDGPAVTMKVTTETAAPPQTINNPMAAAAGGDMTLDKMTGAGTGTMTIRLDSLVPTSSIDQSTSMAMTMNIQGQSMAVSSEGKIKITIAPGKRQ